MRKTWVIMLILVLVVPFYVVGANYIASTKLYNSQNLQKENITMTGGADVNIGVSQLINVEVQRDRWYGVVYGDYGSKVSIENLYLFGFIKTPVKVNGVNWAWYHVGVLGTLIFLFINILIIDLLTRKNIQPPIINTSKD